MVREYTQRQEISRLFDENKIAWLGKKSANQIQRLRGATCHHQRIGRNRDAIIALQKTGQRQAKISISQLITISEQRTVARTQANLGRLAHDIQRQKIKARLSNAKVNKIWLRTGLSCADFVHIIVKYYSIKPANRQ